MMNRYYSVVSPIRVYVHVGHSASNTYIGSSRAINTVMNAENAKPGDEIHALVGGTFLVRDGETFEVSLKAPKHIFEKSYGGHEQPWQIMDRYTKAGRAAALDAPQASADFKAAREKAAVTLPPLQKEMVEVEKSPEYDHLVGALGPVLGSVKRDGGDFKWSASDIDAYGGAKSTVKADGFELAFYVFEDFRIRAKVPENLYRGDRADIEGVLSGNVLMWIDGDEADERIEALVVDAFAAEAAPKP